MLSGCITGCITFRAAMRPARKVMHFPSRRATEGPGRRGQRIAPRDNAAHADGQQDSSCSSAFARYREPAAGSLEDYGVCGADLF